MVMMMQRTRLATRRAAVCAVFILGACSPGTEPAAPSSTSPAPSVSPSRTVDRPAASDLAGWVADQIAAGRTQGQAIEGQGTDAWIIAVEGDARVVLEDGSLVELPADLATSGYPSLVGFGDYTALFVWDDSTPVLWLLNRSTGRWAKGPELGLEVPPSHRHYPVPLGDSVLVHREEALDRGDGIYLPTDQQGVLVSPSLELTPMAPPPDGLFIDFTSIIGSHALVLGNDTGGGDSLPLLQPWDFDAASNSWTPVPTPAWLACNDPCTWNSPHEYGDPFLEAVTGQGVVKLLPDGSVGLYQPDSHQWRQLDTPAFTPTTPETVLLDGDLLVVANQDPAPPVADRPFGTVGVLDVTTGHWETAALIDSTVLPAIIGGWDAVGDGATAVLGLADQVDGLQPRFAYDVGTRTWRTATVDDIAVWRRQVPFEFGAFDLRDLDLSPAAAPITHPSVDPTVCASGATTEFTRVANDDSVPFVVGPAQAVPVQVFARASGGVTDPFAVVLRVAVTDHPQSGADPVMVDGVPVRVSVWPNGNGEAEWTLADGTSAYLRSRDLDEAAILSLIARLQPRESSAAVPGFDLSPPTSPTDLILLDERLNTEMEGTTTRLECTSVVDGGVYAIDVMGGDPTYVYVGVRDRPHPYAVAANGSGALTISGPTAARITLADVVEAE